MASRKKPAPKGPIKRYKNLNRIVTNKQFQLPHQEQTVLGQLKEHKGDGLYRTANFCTEIIWGRTAFMFTKTEKDSSFRKGLFLFNMVKKDALKYVKNRTIELPEKYPVNHYNKKYEWEDDEITGTDVDHAYWRIAYNLKIISLNTYEKGLKMNDADFKALRLATLSSMGSKKQYQVVRDGVITDDFVEVGGNEKLQDAYKLIRYTCYTYMQEAMKILGNDFLGYRTDCIYYRKTRNNIRKVQAFFHSKNLTTKQLYRVSNKSLQEVKTR